jgi:hypothetical protein
MKIKPSDLYKKILLMLLVFAFVISSVSGIIFLTDRYDVMTSDGGDIHVNEYIKDIENERNGLLEQYIQKNGKLEDLDYSFFNSDIFLNTILEKMINQRLIKFEVKYHNINQKVELVASKVLKEQTFYTNNRFDELKFRQHLSEYNITEKQFLDVLKQNEEINFLTGLFTIVTYGDKIMIEKMFKYSNVQKNILYFSKNKKDFIIKSGNYSSEEIAEFYEKNKFLFEVPETKKIDYLEFDDLSQRDNIYEALLTSDTLEELAEKTNKKIKSFGYVNINETLLETKHDLGKIFLLNEKELSDLETVNDKLYVYVVANVREKHFDTIENSRKKIIDLLDEGKRNTLIIENAENLLNKFKKDKNENYLKINGFSSKKVELTRINKEYDDDFIKNVFSKKKNEVTDIFQDEEKVYFAIIKDEIELKLDDENYTPMQTIFKDISESVMSSVQVDYMKYLKEVRYKVKINKKLLKLLSQQSF